MKILLVMIMMLMPVVCFAGDPVIDHIGDALSGRNDFINTNMYVAKTISLEKAPFVNVLNADLRIKMSTPIGDGSFRSGELSIGLEF